MQSEYTIREVKTDKWNRVETEFYALENGKPFVWGIVSLDRSPVETNPYSTKARAMEAIRMFKESKRPPIITEVFYTELGEHIDKEHVVYSPFPFSVKNSATAKKKSKVSSVLEHPYFFLPIIIAVAVIGFLSIYKFFQ